MAFDFMANGTKVGLVDLAVQGAGNWFVTGKAAESPDLRWTWGKEGQPSSPWRDYRFAMGLAGVALNQFGSGDMARAGHDLAAANLHSFIATERVRKSAIEKVAAGAAQPGQAQMPGQPQPQLAPPVADPTQQAAPQPGGAFARFRSAFLPGTYA